MWLDPREREEGRERNTDLRWGRIPEKIMVVLVDGFVSIWYINIWISVSASVMKNFMYYFLMK